MSEQDKLSGERKLVELLVNKYNGKARHSDLMNMSHMKKREFKECIDSLIDREALTVESSTVFKKPVRIYVVDSSIMKDRN